MSIHNHSVRLEHSPFKVFLLGGVSGSLLNLAVSLFLHEVLHWNPYLSFFTGILTNELYHHLYYHILYVNREIHMKTPLPQQGLLYVLVASGGLLLLWLFGDRWGLAFFPSVLSVILCLSLFNTFLVRISHFGSSALAQVEYEQMNDSYYDDQTDMAKVGRFRAWYHASRYRRLTRFVGEMYRPGMAIADLGCGNCLWNDQKLAVTGVDINEKMLRWAVENGRLAGYRVTDDLARTGLPAKSYDIVVMSETLEHLPNLAQALAEVGRILKDDGVFLVTVPYDVFLGPFFILFNLNCVYQGYVRGSRYHRYRCGHINHFTKSRLRQTLESNGFSLTDLFLVNALLLYGKAQKYREKR